MSLRIPLTNDQTLQTEFHEIERRLRKLEKATGVTVSQTVLRTSTSSSSGVNLQSVYDRLTALEAAVTALGSFGIDDLPDFGGVGATESRGLVPTPGYAVPPTGVAQHVLTEDNEWGFPLRGLIHVGTSGEQTDPPYDVVSIDAAVQAGHLQVGDVECFGLNVNGDIEYRDTFYDDLRIEPIARTTGTNAPTFEKWYDDAAGTSRGVYLYSFNDATAGSEKEIFFSMQMPHAWKLGTPIAMHVHWVGAVSDTTAAPRWGLEYTWKDIGEVYGDSVIVYSTGQNIDASGTPDPDVTANKHYISEFTDLVPGTTADGLSSILIGRLFRNSSDAGDTYNAGGAKCGLLYIDAHYETDSPGSSTEYVK